MTEKIPEKDKEVYARRRVPLKRYGKPEEVAHATLNFCLPSSSFINGAVLPVDGGLTIKELKFLYFLNFLFNFVKSVL